MAAVKVGEMEHYLAVLMVLLQADYLDDLLGMIQAERKDFETVDMTAGEMVLTTVSLLADS